MNLPSKNVVLTGATGGIGQVLAAKLFAQGASLILLGRDQDKLTEFKIKYNAKTIQCDLTSRPSREYAIHTILTSVGKPDLLINCAGIGIYKKIGELTEKDWYSSYELNVHTPFFLTRNLQPELTVSLGSCSAFQHVKERTLYNSTKAALRSLTLTLNKEMPGKLIHITLDSTLTPFGPLTLEEKTKKKEHGKTYLDPLWVANKIIEIVSLDHYESEYTLSPECYGNCGPWIKP